MIVILVKYYVHMCVLFKVYQSPAMAPCLGALLRFLPKLASILSVVFDGPLPKYMYFRSVGDSFRPVPPENILIPSVFIPSETSDLREIIYLHIHRLILAETDVDLGKS